MQAYFGKRILIERAPSWLQTRKMLGERQKCVPGSGSWAERRSNGGGGREGKIRVFFHFFSPTLPPPPHPFFLSQYGDEFTIASSKTKTLYCSLGTL